jgi:hypothetical protein
MTKKLKFKDKILIVFYLNGKNLDLYEEINQIQKTFSEIKDDSVEYFILLTKEGENRIECINPVLLDETQYEGVKKKLERIDKEFFKILNNNKDGEEGHTTSATGETTN